jgi:two-component system sensor histidine kinase HydH
MKDKKVLSKIIVTTVMILIIAYLHYFTFPELRYRHAVYWLLFYFPLALGSFWFGLKGATFVSSFVTILYSPYVFEQWHGLSVEDFDRLLEGLLYIGIALILGFLVDKERKKHKALIKAQNLAAVGKAASEIAHDIKTPLLAIGGFAKQVSRRLDPDDPNQKKLEIVIQETIRLECMVKNMLEFGKPLTLHTTEVCLNELVEQTLEVANPIAKNKGVGFLTNLDPSLPTLYLDTNKVKRVILNLINNALSVSPEKEFVLIRTRTVKTRVELEVVDRGCGIKEEDRERIFEPFFSANNGGTGLGLPIIKKIMEAHSGTVFFTPNPEKGVSFTAWFPASKKNNRA